VIRKQSKNEHRRRREPAAREAIKVLTTNMVGLHEERLDNAPETVAS
jgi:hypothetical protein